jgi:hypothetical protein
MQVNLQTNRGKILEAIHLCWQFIESVNDVYMATLFSQGI